MTPEEMQELYRKLEEIKLALGPAQPFHISGVNGRLKFNRDGKSYDLEQAIKLNLDPMNHAHENILKMVKECNKKLEEYLQENGSFPATASRWLH